MDDTNMDPTQDPQNQQASGQNQDDSATSMGDDEAAKIQNELIETQQRLNEMTAISQRALADLQNYKRRMEEEKSSFVQYANMSLFNELLPSIENIYRTLQHGTKDEEWIKGAEQTMKQIISTSEKFGLQAIPTVGQAFDPKLHEALLTAPGEKDIILEELEKGFILGDRVLKQARVKVGNG